MCVAACVLLLCFCRDIILSTPTFYCTASSKHPFPSHPFHHLPPPPPSCLLRLPSTYLPTYHQLLPSLPSLSLWVRGSGTDRRRDWKCIHVCSGLHIIVIFYIYLPPEHVYIIITYIQHPSRRRRKEEDLENDMKSIII